MDELQRLIEDQRRDAARDRDRSRTPGVHANRHREVLGCSEERLAMLAQRHGPSAPSDTVAFVEIDAALTRVAAATLTPNQLAVFKLWRESLNEVQIAESLGKSKQAVHTALRGSVSLQLRGILPKMTEALQNDEEFMSIAKAKTVEPKKVDRAEVSRIKVRNWFMSTKGRSLDFGPLAVLLVLHAAADDDGEVSFSELLEFLPRDVLEHGLHWLRGQGYITYDGKTVLVVKTPDGEVNHADA